MSLLGASLMAGGTSRAVERVVPGQSLAGQLLVATAGLNDPRFSHTVVYMVSHGVDGAMGVVVNRPMVEVPLARLLADLGMPSEGVTGDVRVHYGGPVDRARGVVLHTADYSGKGTVRVTDTVALTPDPGIVRDIALGAGPRRGLFLLGYAGWAPGQLEAEIDAGAWITVSADEGLLFDSDYRSKWDRAMARRAIRL